MNEAPIMYIKKSAPKITRSDPEFGVKTAVNKRKDTKDKMKIKRVVDLAVLSIIDIISYNMKNCPQPGRFSPTTEINL